MKKENKPMLVIEAPIGGGKSNLTKLLSEVLESKAVYEPIADNELLEKFYEDKEKYGFMFQVSMVSRRFDLIKQALAKRNSILDRSIYGDRVFVDLLVKRGEMEQVEADVYYDLLETMLEELQYIPSKTPDLMIYIDLPLELELERIQSRGREFEQIDNDPNLLEYYTQHNEIYNSWFRKFDLCPKITIDATKYDFVKSDKDRKEVLTFIVMELYKIKAINHLELKEAIKKIHSLEDDLKITEIIEEYSNKKINEK